jgi:alpha-galactosidase
VDYVKIDACGGYPSGTTESSLAALYTQFGGDLRADNPYMLYSQELPVPYIGTSYFLPAVSSSSRQSNSWRISRDEYGTFTTVIVRNLNADIHLHAYAHSGHWNDLDMVLPRSIMPSPSDSAYLTYERTQLSGWAMEASPILISADLASLSAAELAALKNSDMIAIDASGAQSAKVVVYAHVDAFVKPAEGGTAVFLINMGTGIASAVFTMTQLGLPAVANWRNIWTGRTGTASSIKITLNPGASTTLIFK